MISDKVIQEANVALSERNGYEAAIDEVQRWCEIHYPGSFVERTIFGPLVRHLRREAERRGRVGG